MKSHIRKIVIHDLTINNAFFLVLYLPSKYFLPSSSKRLEMESLMKVKTIHISLIKRDVIPWINLFLIYFILALPLLCSFLFPRHSSFFCLFVWLLFFLLFLFFIISKTVFMWCSRCHFLLMTSDWSQWFVLTVWDFCLVSAAFHSTFYYKITPILFAAHFILRSQTVQSTQNNYFVFL